MGETKHWLAIHADSGDAQTENNAIQNDSTEVWTFSILKLNAIVL